MKLEFSFCKWWSKIPHKRNTTKDKSWKDQKTQSKYTDRHKVKKQIDATGLFLKVDWICPLTRNGEKDDGSLAIRQSLSKK